MTSWGGMVRRSDSSKEVRKEEIIPITLKVTKREPYYDWTIHQVKLNTKTDSKILRIPFKSYYYDYDVQYYIKEQGVDIEEMNLDMWKDFKNGEGCYKSFTDWVKQQWEKAKQGGSSYLRYTHRKRHLGGIYWLVTITLHMYGEERKVKFVSSCRYENTPSEETLHNYVFDIIREYFSDFYTRQDARVHLTKEEWEDDSNFKELFDAGAKTIELYNNEEWQYF